MQFNWRRRGRSGPIIFQGESNECGLACLAMIAAAWGQKTDLSVLRKRLSPTPRGVNLRTLISMAGKLGLSARPVRIGLHRLSELRLPAILHWNLDHFVVLERLEGGLAHIADPAKGRIRISHEDMSPHFTGIAVELTPTEIFARGNVKLPRQFWKAWLSDSNLRTTACTALWLTVLLQFSILSLPFAYRSILDASQADRGLADGWLIASGIAMMLLVQLSSAWIRARTISQFGAALVHRISLQVVHRLFALPLSYYRQRTTAGILSRVQAVQAVQRFITEQAFPLAIDVLVMMVATVLMAWFSPVLFAVVLLGVALEVAIRVKFWRSEREMMLGLAEAQSREVAVLLESIRGMQTIKLAGREAQRLALWENRLMDSLNAGVGLSVMHGRIAAASGAINTLEWAVLLIAATGILGWGVSYGVLFGFLAYRGILRDRVASILESVRGLQSADVNLQRIDDVMLADTERDEGKSFDLDDAGSIVMENVSFRYAETEKEILSGVSLAVPAGSCVALVGPSGGGKSTLIKILLGIEDASSGKISLGAGDIQDMSRSSWRDCFGTVMQDDTLLSGTIAANISFFDPDVDMEQVHRCARAAAIHDDIVRMPMQYSSLIGDMGSNLSGGQRQRILIARALYRDPKILIFDEGTANIDSDSERCIYESISALNLTRIVIAHRSELVSLADAVYELQEGKLRLVR